MTATATAQRNTLTAGQLPKWAPWGALGAAFALAAGVFLLVSLASGSDFSWTGVAIVGYVLFLIILVLGNRKGKKGKLHA